MKNRLLNAFVLLTLVGLTGCAVAPRWVPRAARPTAEISVPEEDYRDAQPLVDRARADLQERLGVGLDEVTLQRVEAVEFPDTSLGVPEPDKMYAQVVTPGYIIRLVVDHEVYEYHGSGEYVVFAPTPASSEETPKEAGGRALTTALPPGLGLQVLSGQGFALHYPANARVETHEDHLRILGPEIAIRPADADWEWMGWAYEMQIRTFDNPEGLRAADWARQQILSWWREAQAAGEPFTGPVDDGRLREDCLAEVSVAGLPAFQADWFGGDATRRAVYVTDAERVVSFTFGLYPVENSPIARVQDDVYALMLSTFHFLEAS